MGCIFPLQPSQLSPPKARCRNLEEFLMGHFTFNDSLELDIMQNSNELISTQLLVLGMFSYDVTPNGDSVERPETLVAEQISFVRFVLDRVIDPDGFQVIFVR